MEARDMDREPLPDEWDEDTHPEEELWVCQVCDAHLHVDSVPESGCPRCGAPHEDAEADT
jgi:rubrerythrin